MRSRSQRTGGPFTIACYVAALAHTKHPDVERARESGISEYMIDRLSLDEAAIEAIAEAVRQVADLPDPVGEVIRGNTLPNGLELRQLRVPLGVIGIIYEGRPNVTVDAAALCTAVGCART